MHRTDGDNTAGSLPSPQAVGGTVGYFAAEGVVPRTQVTGDWLNAVQEELVNAIEGAGLTLDKTLNGQLLQAIRRLGYSAWWRSLPWLGRDLDLGSNPMTAIFGTNYLELTRVGTTAITYQQTLAIPVDLRTPQVLACKVRYRTTTAFDATFNERLVKLYHVAADGTSTEIATGDITLASTQGSVATMTLAQISTPTLAEGDVLFAQLRIGSTASGTAVGVVRMYGCEVQFAG